MLKTFTIIITIMVLGGCSGQMVCEWQTETEQFEELIREAIKEHDHAQTQTKQSSVPENLQTRQQSTPQKHPPEAIEGRNQALI